jgi:glycosyltransferase involved in cell wall biosynthesis
VVLETDDNLFNVSPLNSAFKGLGVKDMEGNLIPIGHHIGVVQNGERKVLWADGKDGFSLARNRQHLAIYRQLLEAADVVQCSTPEVEKSVLRDSTPRRTKVFPNLVRFDHYPQIDLARDESKVRILWQGGSAHYEDWFPLREALGNISKRYPEVEWILWGAQYPWVNELIPPHRLRFIDWCPYQEYKLRLAMIGHDISLAPLTDNVFNRCRSAIKWYEGSVLKHPVATLAQNTGAYKAEIEDGKTALLFNDSKEFEEKLSTLIENAKLRKELWSNSRQWISENRDAMKVVPSIINYWRELREERKLEQPHMSDSAWTEFEARERAAMEAEMGVGDAAVPAVD